MVTEAGTVALLEDTLSVNVIAEGCAWSIVIVPVEFSPPIMGLGLTDTVVTNGTTGAATMALSDGQTTVTLSGENVNGSAWKATCG